MLHFAHNSCENVISLSFLPFLRKTPRQSYEQFMHNFSTLFIVEQIFMKNFSKVMGEESCQQKFRKKLIRHNEQCVWEEKMRNEVRIRTTFALYVRG